MNDIETTDYVLAATLVAWNCDLKDVNGEANKKVFIFKRTERAEFLVEDFYVGKCRIEPNKFFFSLKTVKSYVNPSRSFNSIQYEKSISDSSI